MKISFWSDVLRILSTILILDKNVSHITHLFINTVSSWQNGWHFAYISIHIFLDQSCFDSKFNEVFVNNNSALVWVMAWCQTEDRPLIQLMMASFTDAYRCYAALMSFRLNSTEMSFWQILYMATAFLILLCQMHNVCKSPQGSYLLMIWYLLMSFSLTYIENWKVYCF